MKKIIVFFTVFLFSAVVWAETGSYSNTTYEIKKSNFKKVKEEFALLANPSANDIYQLFVFAARVCSDRYTNGDYAEKKCKKGENEKILRFFLDNGLPVKSYRVRDVERESPDAEILSISLDTPLGILLENKYDTLYFGRPDVAQKMIPTLDKCAVALAFMQTADPKDDFYYSYADYWRNNNCKLSDFKNLGVVSHVQFKHQPTLAEQEFSEKEQETRAFHNELAQNIGLNKEELSVKYGVPFLYERPSEFREVLTFRTVEKNTEERTYTEDNIVTYFPEDDWDEKRAEHPAGTSEIFFKTIVRDFIFTLDRDVVTHVQVREVFAVNAEDAESKQNLLAKYETERGY